MRPPRPPPGSRAVSLIRARAGVVSASTCAGGRGLVQPTLDHFGHDRMEGRVIRFGDPLGGMGVGDGGPGQIDGGQRLPLRSQVAQEEGDSLGICGHGLPAGEDGPVTERVPCGCVGPAGVGGLGVPQASGDGLGRALVAVRQLQVLLDGAGGGEKGAAVLFHVCGHRKDFTSSWAVGVVAW